MPTWNRRLHGTAKSDDGTTYRVDVDKDGSVSGDTEVTLGRPAFTIEYGSQGGGIFDLIKDTTAKVNIATSDSGVLDQVRSLRADDPYKWRVEVVDTTAGSSYWKGLLLPDYTRTRISDESQIVSLTAKGRIQSLEKPFTGGSGNKIGTDTLIGHLGTILDQLPFNLNILAHLNWWPWDLTDSTDIWTIQVPTETYYSKDADGNLRAASHIEVLKDLLETFSLQIAIWDDHYYIYQPSELQSGNGTSITFREYDRSGNFQQEVSKTSAFTLANDEPFVRDSDELQARRPVRQIRSTFESGKPTGDVVDNPGFESRKESFSRGVQEVDKAQEWVRVTGDVSGRVQSGDVVQWSGGTSSQNGFYDVQAVTTGSDPSYGTFTQITVEGDITDETTGGTITNHTTPTGWTENGFDAADRFIGYDGGTINAAGDITAGPWRHSPIEGNVSLGVEITEAGSASYTDSEWQDDHELTDTSLPWWASQNLGSFSAGETRTLTFTAGIYLERLNTDTIGVESTKIHGYYAIVQDDGGTDKYYDPEAESWTTTKTPIPITGGPITDSGFNFRADFNDEVEVVLTTQAGFPATGDVEIRFYGGILRGQTEDPTGWQGWILYDEVDFKPDAQEPSVSAWTYELTGGASDGPVKEHSVRQGDVPHDGYESGLLLPDDTLTSNWQVGAYTSSQVTDNDESGKSLRQLRAEERLRILKNSRRSIKVEFTSPPAEVTPWTAMDYDGDRYVPVYWSISQPSGYITVTYVELGYNSIPTDVQELVDTFGGAFSGQSAVASDVLQSDLDAILNDIKATQTDEVLSRGTTVTSINVDPLPSGYPSGTVLTLVNQTTASRFTITLSSSVDPGDVGLPIQSFTPSERIAPGSTIYRGGSERDAYIELTNQAIQLFAESQRVATLDENVDGAVTSLAVRDVRTNLPTDFHLRVGGDDRHDEIVVRSDLAEGGSTMQIEEQVVRASKGDPIFLDGAYMAAQLRVQPHLIDLMVQRERNDKGIAQLSSDLSGTVTSLPVTGSDGTGGVDEALESGDEIQVLTRDDEVHNVTTSAAVSSGDTSIPINSATVNAQEGDQVHQGHGSVRTRLSVELGTITADADLLKHDDWDGSVNSSGQITGFASQSSWALTGAGDAEIRDASGNVFQKSDNQGVFKLEAAGKTTFDLAGEQLLFGDATDPTTGTGVFLGKNTGGDGDYEFRIGDPSGGRLRWDGSNLTQNGGTIDGPIIPSISSGSDMMLQGWNFDGTFSADDADTVSWTSGTLESGDGQTFAINSGNTGDIASTTYVYFDKGVSQTALQTTTTRSDAVGGNRILIATAKPNSDSAKKAELYVFGATGGSRPLLTADHIVAGTVTANEMAANTLTAGEIDTGSINLSEWAGDLDDISDGATYARALASTLSGNSVDLGAADGDIDSIADGSTYGKVKLTQISAGEIVLANVSGDLDDVSDGGTYGRVKLTQISSGEIVLANVSGDLDDVSDGGTYGKVKLTNLSAGEVFIKNQSGATAIDGGEIQTGAITATEISVTNLQAVNTSTGALTVSDTLTMGSSGSITNSNGDYVLDDDGLDIEAGAGVYADARAVRWMNGTEVISLIAGIHNWESNSNNYLFLSPNGWDTNSPGQPWLEINTEGANKIHTAGADLVAFYHTDTAYFNDNPSIEFQVDDNIMNMEYRSATPGAPRTNMGRLYWDDGQLVAMDENGTPEQLTSF